MTSHERPGGISRIWGWFLGVLITRGAFVGFIVNRIVRLPGAPGILQGGFFDPPDIVSLVVETFYLARIGSCSNRVQSNE